MTLKRKLVVVFDVVLLLAVLQTGAAMLLLAHVVEQSAHLVNPALDRVDLLAHAEADILRMRTIELSLISVDDPFSHTRLNADLRDLRAATERRLARYSEMDGDPQRAAHAKEVAVRYGAYVDQQEEALSLLATSGRPAALGAYLDGQPTFERLDERMHGLRHLEYAATQALHDDMVAVADRWRWVLVAIVVLVALTDTGLGRYLARVVQRSLAALHDGATRIAAEQFDEPIGTPSEPELAVLAEALNRGMASLAASRAERARLAEEREQMARERMADVVRAQEMERARISRELHDQAAQALTGLRYQLGHLKRLSADPTVHAEVDRLVSLSSDTSRQIAQLARDLRPSVLDDLGLVAALRSCVREMSERTGVDVELTIENTIPRLSTDAETALFRVVQEALTNVAKHAGASQVVVRLESAPAELRLSVRDDGRGFDPEGLPERPSAGPSGLGLAGIRERIQLLDGWVEISSAPGLGTCLNATVPITAAEPLGKAA